jgi:20S proteasome alpha/beta subunit
MSSNNIEVAVVREDKKFQVLTSQQIKEYLDELN